MAKLLDHVQKNLEFLVYLPFQNFDFDYEHIKTIAAIRGF